MALAPLRCAEYQTYHEQVGIDSPKKHAPFGCWDVRVVIGYSRLWAAPGLCLKILEANAMMTGLSLRKFAALFVVASVAGLAASLFATQRQQRYQMSFEAASFRGSVPQGTITCVQHAKLDHVILCSGGGGVCGPPAPCNGTCDQPRIGSCVPVVSFIPNGDGAVYMAKQHCGITINGAAVSTYNTYKCNLPALDECYCNETPANQCGGPFRCNFLPYWTSCSPS